MLVTPYYHDYFCPFRPRHFMLEVKDMVLYAFLLPTFTRNSRPRLRTLSSTTAAGCSLSPVSADLQQCFQYQIL